MRIGNIELTGNALLAPIAGFTDVGLRTIAKRYGASLTYTEMISAKGMFYGSEKTRELLATTEIETPKAVQIFGCESDIMAQAVTYPEMNKFDIIDVNMGCPVPKIVKNNEGSALLHDIPTAQRIVRALIKASGKPVTVKTRLGFYDGEFLAVDFAKAMQDAGVSAITVHGRSREQFYNGNADWDRIAEVVSSVTIPVIANGDVYNLEDYKNILERTGAAGVMIARGAIGNPQLFKEIAGYMNYPTFYQTVDIKRDILAQITTLQGYYDDRYIYSNMKKHICYYVRGKAGGKAIKDKACRAESLPELLDIINMYF